MPTASSSRFLRQGRKPGNRASHPPPSPTPHPRHAAAVRRSPPPLRSSFGASAAAAHKRVTRLHVGLLAASSSPRGRGSLSRPRNAAAAASATEELSAASPPRAEAARSGPSSSPAHPIGPPTEPPTLPFAEANHPPSVQLSAQPPKSTSPESWLAEWTFPQPLQLSLELGDGERTITESSPSPGRRSRSIPTRRAAAAPRHGRALEKKMAIDVDHASLATRLWAPSPASVELPRHRDPDASAEEADATASAGAILRSVSAGRRAAALGTSGEVQVSGVLEDELQALAETGARLRHLLKHEVEPNTSQELLSESITAPFRPNTHDGKRGRRHTSRAALQRSSAVGAAKTSTRSPSLRRHTTKKWQHLAASAPAEPYDTEAHDLVDLLEHLHYRPNQPLEDHSVSLLRHTALLSDSSSTNSLSRSPPGGEAVAARGGILQDSPPGPPGGNMLSEETEGQLCLQRLHKIKLDLQKLQHEGGGTPTQPQTNTSPRRTNVVSTTTAGVSKARGTTVEAFDPQAYAFSVFHGVALRGGPQEASAGQSTDADSIMGSVSDSDSGHRDPPSESGTTEAVASPSPSSQKRRQRVRNKADTEVAMEEASVVQEFQKAMESFVQHTLVDPPASLSTAGVGGRRAAALKLQELLGRSTSSSLPGAGAELLRYSVSCGAFEKFYRPPHDPSVPLSEERTLAERAEARKAEAHEAAMHRLAEQTTERVQAQLLAHQQEILKELKLHQIMLPNHDEGEELSSSGHTSANGEEAPMSEAERGEKSGSAQKTPIKKKKKGSQQYAAQVKAERVATAVHSSTETLLLKEIQQQRRLVEHLVQRQQANDERDEMHAKGTSSTRQATSHKRTFKGAALVPYSSNPPVYSIYDTSTAPAHRTSGDGVSPTRPGGPASTTARWEAAMQRAVEDANTQRTSSGAASPSWMIPAPTPQPQQQQPDVSPASVAPGAPLVFSEDPAYPSSSSFYPPPPPLEQQRSTTTTDASPRRRHPLSALPSVPLEGETRASTPPEGSVPQPPPPPAMWSSSGPPLSRSERQHYERELTRLATVLSAQVREEAAKRQLERQTFLRVLEQQWTFLQQHHEQSVALWQRETRRLMANHSSHVERLMAAQRVEADRSARWQGEREAQLIQSTVGVMGDRLERALERRPTSRRGTKGRWRSAPKEQAEVEEERSSARRGSARRGTALISRFDEEGLLHSVSSGAAKGARRHSSSTAQNAKHDPKKKKNSWEAATERHSSEDEYLQVPSPPSRSRRQRSAVIQRGTSRRTGSVRSSSSSSSSGRETVLYLPFHQRWSDRQTAPQEDGTTGKKEIGGRVPAAHRQASSPATPSSKTVQSSATRIPNVGASSPSAVPSYRKQSHPYLSATPHPSTNNKKKMGTSKPALMPVRRYVKTTRTQRLREALTHEGSSSLSYSAASRQAGWRRPPSCVDSLSSTTISAPSKPRLAAGVRVFHSRNEKQAFDHHRQLLDSLHAEEALEDDAAPHRPEHGEGGGVPGGYLISVPEPHESGGTQEAGGSHSTLPLPTTPLRDTHHFVRSPCTSPPMQLFGDAAGRHHSFLAAGPLPLTPVARRRPDDAAELSGRWLSESGRDGATPPPPTAAAAALSSHRRKKKEKMRYKTNASRPPPRQHHTPPQRSLTYSHGQWRDASSFTSRGRGETDHRDDHHRSTRAATTSATPRLGRVFLMEKSSYLDDDDDDDVEEAEGEEGVSGDGNPTDRGHRHPEEAFFASTSPAVKALIMEEDVWERHSPPPPPAGRHPRRAVGAKEGPFHRRDPRRDPLVHSTTSFGDVEERHEAEYDASTTVHGGNDEEEGDVVLREDPRALRQPHASSGGGQGRQLVRRGSSAMPPLRPSSRRGSPSRTTSVGALRPPLPTPASREAWGLPSPGAASSSAFVSGVQHHQRHAFGFTELRGIQVVRPSSRTHPLSRVTSPLHGSASSTAFSGRPTPQTLQRAVADTTTPGGWVGAPLLFLGPAEVVPVAGSERHLPLSTRSSSLSGPLVSTASAAEGSPLCGCQWGPVQSYAFQYEERQHVPFSRWTKPQERLFPTATRQIMSKTGSGTTTNTTTASSGICKDEGVSAPTPLRADMTYYGREALISGYQLHAQQYWKACEAYAKALKQLQLAVWEVLHDPVSVGERGIASTKWEEEGGSHPANPTAGASDSSSPPGGSKNQDGRVWTGDRLLTQANTAENSTNHASSDLDIEATVRVMEHLKLHRLLFASRHGEAESDEVAQRLGLTHSALHHLVDGSLSPNGVELDEDDDDEEGEEEEAPREDGVAGRDPECGGATAHSRRSLFQKEDVASPEQLPLSPEELLRRIPRRRRSQYPVLQDLYREVQRQRRGLELLRQEEHALSRGAVRRAPHRSKPSQRLFAIPNTSAPYAAVPLDPSRHPHRPYHALTEERRVLGIDMTRRTQQLAERNASSPQAGEGARPAVPLAAALQQFALTNVLRCVEKELISGWLHRCLAEAALGSLERERREPPEEEEEAEDRSGSPLLPAEPLQETLEVVLRQYVEDTMRRSQRYGPHTAGDDDVDDEDDATAVKTADADAGPTTLSPATPLTREDAVRKDKPETMQASEETEMKREAPTEEQNSSCRARSFSKVHEVEEEGGHSEGPQRMPVQPSSSHVEQGNATTTAPQEASSVAAAEEIQRSQESGTTESPQQQEQPPRSSVEESVVQPRSGMDVSTKESGAPSTRTRATSSSASTSTASGSTAAASVSLPSVPSDAPQRPHLTVTVPEHPDRFWVLNEQLTKEDTAGRGAQERAKGVEHMKSWMEAHRRPTKRQEDQETKDGPESNVVPLQPPNHQAMRHEKEESSSFLTTTVTPVCMSATAPVNVVQVVVDLSPAMRAALERPLQNALANEAPDKPQHGVKAEKTMKGASASNKPSTSLGGAGKRTPFVFGQGWNAASAELYRPSSNATTPDEWREEEKESSGRGGPLPPGAPEATFFSPHLQWWSRWCSDMLQREECRERAQCLDEEAVHRALLRERWEPQQQPCRGEPLQQLLAPPLTEESPHTHTHTTVTTRVSSASGSSHPESAAEQMSQLAGEGAFRREGDNTPSDTARRPEHVHQDTRNSSLQPTPLAPQQIPPAIPTSSSAALYLPIPGDGRAALPPPLEGNGHEAARAAPAANEGEETGQSSGPDVTTRFIMDWLRVFGDGKTAADRETAPTAQDRDVTTAVQVSTSPLPRPAPSPPLPFILQSSASPLLTERPAAPHRVVTIDTAYTKTTATTETSSPPVDEEKFDDDEGSGDAEDGRRPPPRWEGSPLPRNPYITDVPMPSPLSHHFPMMDSRRAPHWDPTPTSVTTETSLTHITGTPADERVAHPREREPPHAGTGGEGGVRLVSSRGLQRPPLRPLSSSGTTATTTNSNAAGTATTTLTSHATTSASAPHHPPVRTSKTSGGAAALGTHPRPPTLLEENAVHAHAGNPSTVPYVYADTHSNSAAVVDAVSSPLLLDSSTRDALPPPNPHLHDMEEGVAGVSGPRVSTCSGTTRYTMRSSRASQSETSLDTMERETDSAEVPAGEHGRRSQSFAAQDTSCHFTSGPPPPPPPPVHPWGAAGGSLITSRNTTTTASSFVSSPAGWHEEGRGTARDALPWSPRPARALQRGFFVQNLVANDVLEVDGSQTVLPPHPVLHLSDSGQTSPRQLPRTPTLALNNYSKQKAALQQQQQQPDVNHWSVSPSPAAPEPLSKHHLPAHRHHLRERQGAGDTLQEHRQGREEVHRTRAAPSGAFASEFLQRYMMRGSRTERTTAAAAGTATTGWEPAFSSPSSMSPTPLSPPGVMGHETTYGRVDPPFGEEERWWHTPSKHSRPSPGSLTVGGGAAGPHLTQLYTFSSSSLTSWSSPTPRAAGEVDPVVFATASSSEWAVPRRAANDPAPLSSPRHNSFSRMSTTQSRGRATETPVTPRDAGVAVDGRERSGPMRFFSRWMDGDG